MWLNLTRQIISVKSVVASTTFWYGPLKTQKKHKMITVQLKVLQQILIMRKAVPYYKPR